MPNAPYMTVVRQPLRRSPMVLYSSRIGIAQRIASSSLLLVAKMNDIRPGNFEPTRWTDHLRVLQSSDPRIDCWVFRVKGDEMIDLVRSSATVHTKPLRITHWTGLKIDTLGYAMKQHLDPIFEDADRKLAVL